jgi:hypothetical protein
LYAISVKIETITGGLIGNTSIYPWAFAHGKGGNLVSEASPTLVSDVASPTKRGNENMKNKKEEEDLRRYKEELRVHALKNIANSSKSQEQRMRKMFANCDKLREAFEEPNESIRQLKARGWSADKLVNA